MMSAVGAGVGAVSEGSAAVGVVVEVSSAVGSAAVSVVVEVSPAAVGVMMGVSS